jgi:hypothetical protein
MKTLFLLISFISLSAWSNIETPSAVPMPKRTLKDLYQKLDSAIVNAEKPVLKDYNLLVSSGTWWPGSAQAEAMWENLAQARQRELNVIIVYDAPKQDVAKIQAKSTTTLSFEFYDKNRDFYYWFSQKTLMDAVLIGPKGEILFQGLLNSPEKIEQVKALIKKKEA